MLFKVNVTTQWEQLDAWAWIFAKVMEEQYSEYAVRAHVTHCFCLAFKDGRNHLITLLINSPDRMSYHKEDLVKLLSSITSEQEAALFQAFESKLKKKTMLRHEKNGYEEGFKRFREHLVESFETLTYPINQIDTVAYLLQFGSNLVDKPNDYIPTR